MNMNINSISRGINMNSGDEVTSSGGNCKCQWEFQLVDWVNAINFN